MGRAAKTYVAPKLVLGYIEVIAGDDMDVSIPDDEAVIHLEGHEDSEIEVHCPGALRLASLIVKATNGHADLLTALRRIVSLDEKNVTKFAQDIAREALAPLPSADRRSV